MATVPGRKSPPGCIRSRAGYSVSIEPGYADVRRCRSRVSSDLEDRAMSEANIEPALSRQAHFRYDEVSSGTTFRARAVTAPPLGPLTAFAGTFKGSGLNTIFRPNSTKTPTGLPVAPVGPDDNVLELNLTA